jgi:hypothetical protein
MDEEIKVFPKDTILSINKDLIVLFRGKDILCHVFPFTLLDREVLEIALLDEEEREKLNMSLEILVGNEQVESRHSFTSILVISHDQITLILKSW